MGILSQTAGSTCEYWVNPVNFTFGAFDEPSAWKVRLAGRNGMPRGRMRWPGRRGHGSGELCYESSMLHESLKRGQRANVSLGAAACVDRLLAC
jgi:hypothetical protein